MSYRYWFDTSFNLILKFDYIIITVIICVIKTFSVATLKKVVGSSEKN